MSRDDFIQLEPIDIEGDVSRQPGDLDPLAEGVIAIDPIDIEGRVPKAPVDKAIPASTWVERLMAFTSGDPEGRDAVRRLQERIDASRSPSAAAAHGAADAVSFGFADELRGLADPEGVGYDVSRDAARERMGELEERHPGAYGAGQGAGLVGTLGLLAPLSMLRPATGLGRVGLAATEGAALGALGGAGATEGDVGTGEFARDTGGAALAGGALGGALGVAGEGARRLVNRLRTGAEGASRRAAVQRVRQAGPDRLSDLGRIMSRGEPEQIVGDLRGMDPGVFGPLGMSGSEAVGRRIGAAGEGAYETAQGLRQQVAGQPAVLRGAVERLRRHLVSMPQSFEGASKIRRQVRGWMDELSRMADEGASFEEVDRARDWVGRQMSDAIRNADTPRAEALRAQYGALAQALEDTVQAATGQGAAWRAAQRGQELGIAFGDVGARAGLAEQARRMMSPSDYVATFGTAAGGASAGDSVLMGILNRLVRRNEPAVRATWNEGLARLGRSLPEGSGGDVLDVLRRAIATRSPEVAGAIKGAAGGQQMDSGMPDEAPAEMAPVEIGGGPELTPEDAEALEALGLADETLTDEDQAALEALGL